MKVLAVEASSVIAGAALMDGERLVYEAYSHHQKNHSQSLMSLVESALIAGDTRIEEIDLFAVTNGPGSFTGLRIGTATIKGLAMAYDKPVAAIPTLDLLAFNLPFCTDLICPILDARREQVYTTLFHWDGETLIRMNDYQAIQVSDLISRLKSYARPIHFVGDGISSYQQILMEGLGEYALFAPPHLRYQRASTTAYMGRQYFDMGLCIRYKELEPFYLRQSQAEQQLCKRGAKQE